MHQIKVAVTPEEHALLQQRAHGQSISVSALAHSLLFTDGKLPEPSLPESLDWNDCSRISFTLPRELLEGIAKEADTAHLSRSQYIARLLVQKGRPVLLDYSACGAAALSVRLQTLMDNVNYIAWASRQDNHRIYDAELATVIRDLTDACRLLRETSWQSEDQTRREIESLKAQIYRMKSK